MVITVTAAMIGGLADFNAPPKRPSLHENVSAEDILPLMKPSAPPDTAANPIFFELLCVDFSVF